MDECCQQVRLGRRGWLAVLVVAAVLGALAWWRHRPAAPAPPPAPAAHEWTDPNIMGTYARVKFYEDEARSAAARDTVFALFAAVNQRFSDYRADSELSRLNASAYDAPFACSPGMWALLLEARAAHKLSGGAFDVSIGPLMKLWGFHRKRQTVPSADDLAAAVAQVGLDKITFDDAARTVRFSVPGMALDFGGIAKGWAVDLAADAVRAMGIRRGLIDLGGNLCVLDEPPPGQTHYRVGVRHPRHPKNQEQLLCVVPMLNQAIATSGDYERFVELEGKRYSHIMDPRTGRPVGGMAGVTIVAPRALTTDILSTTIFVQRAEKLDELLAGLPGVQVLVVRADDAGKLTVAPHGPIWPAIPPP